MHNGGASGSLWQPQIDALSADRDVIAPDLLGFGDSDKPDCNYSLDRYVASATAFVDALGIDEFDIVGSCIGATIATNIAAQQPDRVGCVIAQHPYSSLTVTGGQHERSVRLAQRSPRTLRAASWVLPRAVPKRLLAREILANYQASDGDDFATELVDLYRDPANFRVLASIAANARSFVPRASTVPTYLLWGRDNPVIPVGNLEAIEALLQPEETVVIANAGHMASRERPAEFTRLLQRFLAS